MTDGQAFELAVQAYGTLVNAVRRAMAAGVIAEGPLTDTAQILWASVHGWVSLELLGIGFVKIRTQSSIGRTLRSCRASATDTPDPYRPGGANPPAVEGYVGGDHPLAPSGISLEAGRSRPPAQQGSPRVYGVALTWAEFTVAILGDPERWEVTS